MGLYYPNQTTFAAWGSVALVYQNDKATISTATRTPVTLESSYQSESPTVATKTFATAGFSKLNLDILYTMGASETSNTIEIQFEGSPDGVNFYRIPNESTSTTTSTLYQREIQFAGANGAATTISFGLDIFYNFVRVSAKETGVAANKGTVFGQVTLLGK